MLSHGHAQGVTVYSNSAPGQHYAAGIRIDCGIATVKFAIVS